MEITPQYLETHFEVVSVIINSTEYNTIKEVYDNQGTGGLYELAKDWTDEFEKKFQDVVWGEDLDYFDTIDAFLNNKLG
jgi:hypothetical protein